MLKKALNQAKIWHFDPENHAKSGSKLSTLYINLNNLNVKPFRQKIKKISWAELKIWPNGPKSGKNLTFWPPKSCLIGVEIINFIHQSKSFKAKIIHAKNKKNWMSGT